MADEVIGIVDEQLKPLETYIPSGETWAVSELLNKFKVIALADGANVDIDSGQGKIFTLSAGGDRTINAPTGKEDGRTLIIRHYASGANRTLTLTTGSAGAFRFGTTITALSATASGKTDYIGCIYNATDDRWDVVSVVKGF